MKDPRSTEDKANALRIAIMQLTDEQLLLSNCEINGTVFMQLPDYIKHLAAKCKRELPF